MTDQCGKSIALRFHPGAFPPPQRQLTKAAFLCARNDALANVAIIAGFITATTLSAWPDLMVGLGFFFMNLAARP